MTTKKLKYEKINNSDNAITIDLHNGYTIMAITGCVSENVCTTTLFIKCNTIENWSLIENAETLNFTIKPNTNIYIAILKKVSSLLSEGFFDYYIDRYEYELKCYELGSNQLSFKEFLDVK